MPSAPSGPSQASVWIFVIASLASLLKFLAWISSAAQHTPTNTPRDNDDTSSTPPPENSEPGASHVPDSQPEQLPAVGDDTGARSQIHLHIHHCKLALVIGRARYADQASLDNLDGVAAATASLSHTLAEMGYIVHVLSDVSQPQQMSPSEQWTVCESIATANVEQAVVDLIHQAPGHAVTPHDQLLVYLVGHGETATTATPAGTPEFGMIFGEAKADPHTGQWSQLFSLSLLANILGVTDPEQQRWGQVLVIIDACKAGAAILSDHLDKVTPAWPFFGSELSESFLKRVLCPCFQVITGTNLKASSWSITNGTFLQMAFEQAWRDGSVFKMVQRGASAPANWVTAPMLAIAMREGLGELLKLYNSVPPQSEILSQVCSYGRVKVPGFDKNKGEYLFFRKSYSPEVSRSALESTDNDLLAEILVEANLLQETFLARKYAFNDMCAPLVYASFEAARKFLAKDASKFDPVEAKNLLDALRDICSELEIPSDSATDSRQFRLKALSERLSECSGGDRLSSAALHFWPPSLPRSYVSRQKDLQRIRRFLLGNDALASGAVPMYTLVGEGGLGKTMLARGVVHDKQFQLAFGDRVRWVAIGQQSTRSVESTLVLLEQSFGGTGIDLNGLDNPIEKAVQSLAQQIGTRHVLIVLDDVWEMQTGFTAALYDVCQQAPGCRVLVTTRHRRVAHDDSSRLALETLPRELALEMLCKHASWDTTRHGFVPDCAGKIVDMCGGLPLAIALVGGILAHTAATREGWSAVFENVRQALPNWDFESSSTNIPLTPFQATKMSLDAMEDPMDELKFVTSCYKDLVVFGKGAQIPSNTIVKMWTKKQRHLVREASQSKETIGTQHVIDNIGATTLQRLVNGSLLQQSDGDGDWVTMHAVQFDYIDVETKANTVEERAKQHRIVFSVWNDSYGKKSNSSWCDLPRNAETEFLLEHLIEQMAGAGETVKMCDLLLSFRWIWSRVADGRTKGNVSSAVLRDYAAAVRHLTMLISRPQHSDLSTKLAALRMVRDVLALGYETSTAFSDRSLTLFLQGHLGAEKNDFVVSLLQSATDTLKNSMSGPYLEPSASWKCSFLAHESNRRAEMVLDSAHVGGVTSVAVSTDGMYIATGGADGVLCWWDVSGDDGTLVWRSDILAMGRDPTVGNPIHALIITSDNEFNDTIVTGASDSTVRWWSTTDGTSRGEAAKLHTKAVRALASPSVDASFVVSGSQDESVWVWKDGAPAVVLEGHCDTVSSVSVIQTLDLLKLPKLHVASASVNGEVRVWEVKSDMSGDSDSNMAVDLDRSQVVRQKQSWATLTTFVSLRLPDLYDGYLELFAMGGADKLAVWRLSFDAQGGVVQVEDESDVGLGVGQTSCAAKAVALSTDRSLAVTGCGERLLRVWDAASSTERQLGMLLGNDASVTSVALTTGADSGEEDGLVQVVAGTTDGATRVWFLPDVSRLREAAVRRKNVLNIVVSGNGQRLAIGYASGRVELWDIESGQLLANIEPSSSVLSLALDETGDHVLTGSKDGQAILWSSSPLESGFDTMQQMEKHNDAVDVVALASDGTVAVTCSSGDPSVSVWRLNNTWKRVAMFGDVKKLKDVRVAAIYSENDDSLGHRLYFGFDTVIRAWTLPPVRVLRDLREEEEEGEEERDDSASLELFVEMVGHVSPVCGLWLGGRGAPWTLDESGDVRLWRLPSPDTPIHSETCVVPVQATCVAVMWLGSVTENKNVFESTASSPVALMAEASDEPRSRRSFNGSEVDSASLPPSANSSPRRSASLPPLANSSPRRSASLPPSANSSPRRASSVGGGGRAPLRKTDSSKRLSLSNDQAAESKKSGVEDFAKTSLRIVTNQKGTCRLHVLPLYGSAQTMKTIEFAAPVQSIAPAGINRLVVGFDGHFGVFDVRKLK